MEERVCVVCGYIYGPERDDFENSIPPDFLFVSCPF
jgi:rubredoxin